MNNINFNNWKARCSSLSLVCSESRSSAQLTVNQIEELDKLNSLGVLTPKQQERMAYLELKAKKAKELTLSDSYLTYLMDEYAYYTEGMIPVLNDFEGLQMANGTLVEADSLITLIQAEQKPYQPNINDKDEQERIYNEFLSGCPDAYLGKSLMEAEEIPDIKSSFDYPTFLKKINMKLSKANEMQLQGYGDITGAKTLFIADCLTNTHQTVVDGLKWKLLKKLEGSVASEESPEFKKQWAIIERSTKFDHLSPKLRTNKRYVEPFTEHERQFVYDQVKKGRDFLSKFYEERQKLN